MFCNTQLICPVRSVLDNYTRPVTHVLSGHGMQVAWVGWGQNGKPVLTSCSGPSLCVVWSSVLSRGLSPGTPWAQRGHSVGTPAVANSWPLPQRVLLVLRSLSTGFLVSTLAARSRSWGQARHCSGPRHRQSSWGNRPLTANGTAWQKELVNDGQQSGLGQVSGGFIQETGVGGVLMLVD